MWFLEIRTSGVIPHSPEGRHSSPRGRLKGLDHSFAQKPWIAFSAFRGLDYRFGDEKGHGGLAVSHIQLFKHDFMRGGYHRDVLRVKRRSFYVQKPPNRHRFRPPAVQTLRQGVRVWREIG
jgi:hypothetical protein